MDDRSFVAAQDAILDMKKFWTTEIYGALKSDYRRLSARQPTPPETVDEVAGLIGSTTLYRYFAWAERHLQRFKYSGRYGLAPYHLERREVLRARLDAMAGDPRLELNPSLELPKYYKAIDIHQHPGGVWRDDVAALIYERGARSTTPMLGGKHRDLHQRLTDIALSGCIPNRLLDMGCGFGKSTRPFYEALPEAEIEAVDLSASCCELGAADAADAQARNVRFRQMNAYETDYPDEDFDLVTSTMLLHELPPREIGRTFDEAYRVLKPGGRMVHLDFHRLPDAFARFLHYGHGRRNNEPFMQPWAEMDITAELSARGFREIEVLPFAEADGVDVDDSPAWRFPWTVVQAAK